MLERTPGYWKVTVDETAEGLAAWKIVDLHTGKSPEYRKLGDVLLYAHSPEMYDLLWEAVAFFDGKSETHKHPGIFRRWRDSVVELLAVINVIPHQGIDLHMPQYLIDEVEKLAAKMNDEKGAE